MFAWLERPAMLVVVAVFALLAASTAAAEDGYGQPPLQFFGPRDYNAGPLNWSVVQDARGLIYAANADGVLEFDGVSWRLIRTDRHTRARALAYCPDGRIYVGAQGEFGYLASSAGNGQELAFVSLSQQLPAEQHDFSDIWLIHCLGDGVYFRSQRRLFRLQGETLESWSMADVGYSAVVDGQLYLFDRQLGLLRQHAGEWQPIGGTSFDAVGDLQVLLPWQRSGRIAEPADGLLLGSRQQGLQLLLDGRLQSFPSPLTPLLARDGLRGSRLLPNGSVLLLTLAEGPLLLDSQGRLLRRLGRAEGIAGDRAFEAIFDQHGDLWLALDTGIARVAAFDPLTRYDESTLGGSVLVSLRHRQRLYVGSNTRLTWLRASPAEAEAIAITGYVRGLLDVDGSLLAAGNGGSFLVDDAGSRALRSTSASELLHSQFDRDRVWVAERDGLAALYRRDGVWEDEGKRWTSSSVVRSLAEDRHGGLWLGTDLDGVLYLPAAASLPAGPLAAGQWQRFGLADGLPTEEENQVFALDGDVLIRTRDGIYRFDPELRRFHPDPRFAAVFASRPGWQLSPRGGLAVDLRGWIWLQARREPGNDSELGALVAQEDGRYQWQADGFQSLRGLNVTSIYAEGEHLLWFGTNEGLFRHDRRLARALDRPFTTLIRRVELSGGRALYAGGASASSQSAGQPVAAADNQLRFEFAAAFFVEPGATRYQTWLEGYDRDWSAWTVTSHREFTNLDPGRYRFRVRARNLYDRLGSEADYRFELLAPWHRSWPAYFGYAVLALALGWLALRWRVRRLEHDKDELARHVAERTEELRQARDHAERQRLVAERATRAKSDFLASMSHEIRTPMNAIIGFAQLGQQLPLPPAARDYFDKIAGAGEALLGIVNDILDYSKIEAGKLELEHAEFELGALLRRVEDLFTHQAEAKGIELVLAPAPEIPPRLIGDSLRLAQVLINLSNNALKFTERGEVVLKVDLLRQQERQIELRFSVRDSGIGIAKGQLDELFQPFAQADAGTARRFGGTGLGLAISQRLVGLMGGRFEVDSEPGRGSEFAFNARFELPASQPRPRNLHERLGDLRILVVDDNASVRTVLLTQIASFGLSADAVDSADAAFTAIEAASQQGRPYGLVLLDWQMPGIDGVEASRQIVASGAQSPATVVMITGHSGSDLRERTRGSGLRGVLTKPVSPSLLFNVLLQACDAIALPNEAATAAPASSPLPPQLAGRHLLVVEDNPLNQQVAREILQLAAVETSIAESGEAALRMIGERRFDGVLMDVHMPGMDGLEATRRIRALGLPYRLPIIAMTADVMPGYREACLEAGMDEALSKPIGSARLFATLAHWIADAPAPAAEVVKPEPPAGVLASDRAIARLGDRPQAYRRLLARWCEQWADLPQRLRAAIDAGRDREAEELAHSFKGIAANLGAEQAAVAATVLERTLRHGEGDRQRALDALGQQCSAALRAAEAWLAAHPEIAEANTDRVPLPELLDQLAAGLNRRDPAVEALLPALRQHFGPNHLGLKALEAALESYDFSRAVDLLVVLRAAPPAVG